MENILDLQAVETDETEDSQGLRTGGESAAFGSGFSGRYYEAEQAEMETDA